MDIFSRLPVSTLFNCRCVCKKLLYLISDPEFARIHYSRSPLGILIRTLPPRNESKRLQFAQIEDSASGFQAMKLSFTAKDNIPTCDVTLRNSCNGLLCVSGSGKDDPIYVCNPIIGEYLTIQPPHKGRHRGSFSGLGFSPVTGQYKVLQTYYPVVESPYRYIEAEIYTIGTGKWKSIGNAPPDIVTLPFNSFLNGALHWYPCTPNASEFIHAFDFDKEQFRAVPPPPHVGQNDKKCTDFTRTGVLGGCLFMVFFENSMRIDIWIMKEYGNRESWTKQFVVENLYPKQGSWDFYEPIIVLDSGEILMLYNNDLVVCYNQKRKSLRGTRMFRTRSQFNAIAYTPCFVSLSNLAKGEQILRMRGTREYERHYAEEFQSCVGCGVPIFNSGDSLQPFSGATSYPGSLEERSSAIMCENCGEHVVAPEKSFLSLWSL